MAGKAQCADASGSMNALLESFVNRDNGITGKDVWQPVISILDELAAWIEGQSGPSWRMISVSLLVIYEGTATDAESTRARCALVDFAHTFFVDQGPDDSTLRGLTSLRCMLAGMIAGQ